MRREIDFRQRLESLQTDLLKYKDTTVIIAADLARVYKVRQDSLIQELNKADYRNDELLESCEIAKHEMTSLFTEKDARIFNCNQRIQDLKRKLADMTTEFSHMLQASVNLLRDKVALVTLVTSDESYAESTRITFQKRLTTNTNFAIQN